MNIEMRHLRYFVAVAEEASFTAAAQRVHVAQQVLSTQIRQLEGAIGSELLQRTSRGCAPARFRDDWLVVPRPGGDVPVIGAVAATIEEWREHIAAGRGISLCPASSEAFSARPDIMFVPSRGVPVTALSVAWRAEDVRPEVVAFVKVATSAGAAGGGAAAVGGAEAVGGRG
jgi:DNA-binding transcriptional LysR family regulator